jgi:hypothetical protein
VSTDTRRVLPPPGDDAGPGGPRGHRPRSHPCARARWVTTALRVCGLVGIVVLADTGAGGDVSPAIMATAPAGRVAPVAAPPSEASAPPGEARATPSGVSATPTGPPTPASGWHVNLADDFNAPLGDGPGEDHLWYPGPDPYQPATKNADGDNGYETEVYNSSQVSVKDGNLVLSARYDQDVAPATGNGLGRTDGNRVQRNYVSGMVVSASHSAGTQGFDWTPGDGSTWAFEIDCQFPPATGELFNAFWSSTQGGWSNERDFFEGHNANHVDTDWIYRTDPYKSSYYLAALKFNPSSAMHRYTYVINPDQSWSLYIDGVLQKWVGVDGVSPPEASVDTPMEVIINYGLDATTFTAGSRSFLINSVAVYQDNANAGQSTIGGGIAPGTVITK